MTSKWPKFAPLPSAAGSITILFSSSKVAHVVLLQCGIIDDDAIKILKAIASGCAKLTSLVMPRNDAARQRHPVHRGDRTGQRPDPKTVSRCTEPLTHGATSRPLDELARATTLATAVLTPDGRARRADDVTRIVSANASRGRLSPCRPIR